MTAPEEPQGTGWIKAQALRARFEEFDAAYPEVAEALAKATRDYLRETGDRHVGFPMIWEVVRYSIAISPTPVPYKLNNDLRSWYARALMQRYPDLRDVFEIRTSYADGEAA